MTSCIHTYAPWTDLVYVRYSSTIHLDDTSNAPNWRTDGYYCISDLPPYSLPFNHHHNFTSAYHLHPGRVALVINTDLPSPDIYTSQTDKLGVVRWPNLAAWDFYSEHSLTGPADSVMQSSSISLDAQYQRPTLCPPLADFSRC